MKPVLFLCAKFPTTSETFVADQVKAFVYAGDDVKVLSIEAGDNFSVWKKKFGIDISVHVMHEKFNLIQWMKNFSLVVSQIVLHPRSWAITSYCIFRSPAQVRNALIAARWLRQYPQQGSLLICHFGTVGYIGALLRAWGLLHMPQVTIFHGFDMSSLVLKKGLNFYRKLFDSPKHLSVTITQLWKRRLNEMGERNAYWIPLGVDVESIIYHPRRFPVNRPVRLITVGRLVDKKGQADVLKALASLPSSCKDWEYHLVGAGTDESILKRLALALGLQNKVVWHGARQHEETLEILADADVFVLASRTGKDGDMEGLPVVLMEALASGLPTISTRHSGIPELIDHGRTGLLSPEGDISSLRENISFLLENPDLWGKIAIEGRRQVEKNYNITKNFSTFKALSTDVFFNKFKQ